MSGKPSRDVSEFHVLGIDPGVTVGFALLGCDGEDWWLVDREEYRWEHVVQLYDRLQNWACGDYHWSMERMLAYRQATADEKVEAQAIVKLCAALNGRTLEMYAPATIRSAVVGTGKATPAQIKATIRHLLDLPKISKRGEAFTPHQQDAVATALCFLVCAGWLKVLKQAKKQEQ
jgi:Holliday junction resolvasome RuvABC endonuclease subunit